MLLRKDYDARFATRPEEALKLIREMTDPAVVVSDMQMPGMDGATLLREVMLLHPDVTRIVLTGEPGRDLAIAAVNKGQIFRFLTKPCAIGDLKAAIDAGVIRHRLVLAERAVLRETLIGLIKSLMEVLAIASPPAFGRAERIKRDVMDVATRLGIRNFWQLEAAALLSQIGYVALPHTLIEKLQAGVALEPGEFAEIDAVPDISKKLLEHIPRLESVVQILVGLTRPDAEFVAQGDGLICRGTKILGAVIEYDSRIIQGETLEAAFAHLRGRIARYGQDVIDALDKSIHTSPAPGAVIEVLLRHVRPGMTLLHEMHRENGMLLFPRNFEVTKTFLQRIENIAPEMLDTLVRVRISEGALT